MCVNQIKSIGYNSKTYNYMQLHIVQVLDEFVDELDGKYYHVVITKQSDGNIYIRSEEVRKKEDGEQTST